MAGKIRPTKREADRAVPVRLSQKEGLDVGDDMGTPVKLSYDVPYNFSGKLGKVTAAMKQSRQVPPYSR
jgi:hypothetical protein